ncbi:MAG: hypothetical protein ACRCY9_14640, partial [Phycicoccus sp.]
FVGRPAAVPAVLVAGGLLVAGWAALGPHLSPADVDRPVEDASRAPEGAARQPLTAGVGPATDA